MTDAFQGDAERLSNARAGFVTELLEDLAPVNRDELRQNVWRCLREEREARGIGVREMGRRVGIDASNLSKLEAGKAWSEKWACLIACELWPLPF